ncbi:arsenate reductase ArsC [Candidatus Actinomarina]|jgi:arsenate reductase|nr:arsenate reductase ArsC [Actinomycetota bacterium]MDA9602212.1 arsenate reductase ArsC [Candidatus Actinomarina sp.]MDA9676875.1 arsenate reductase ArsC [bacterium]|tara:strand:+ start:145 stop:549 length:405 start_codon:yes stop_codon:yes gene_type:complete
MKIIVICTGNTCRSQIAEGLLKSKYPEAEIYSAGTHPEIQVNPYAVQAMAEVGYDISKQYPKLVTDFINEEFDYVLTVCDSAQETCPVFPNAKNRVHNSFVDPSRSSYESDEHALEVYKNTVKEISNWIDNLNL